MKARTHTSAQEERIQQQETKPAPVIVLNLFHSGLGIARALAGTGIRVVGLTANAWTYGNFTRTCEVRPAPDSEKHPEKLSNFLVEAAFGLRAGVIFPTRDADLLFLDRFRRELSPFYRLAVPHSDLLVKILDKTQLIQIAAGAGLPVPRTIVLQDASQLPAAAEAIGFPSVIKPVRSLDWREGSNWRTVGRRKAFRVNSFSELFLKFKQISQVRSGILLQEWIPGPTDRIMVWAGYVDGETQSTVHFTARKIVQSPEDFGTGCVVESVLLPQLTKPSLTLCRALGYSGIAEIEFKRDPRDGRVKLIELNPRHWDWHQLGAASSVNITLAAYEHLTGSTRNRSSHVRTSLTRRNRPVKWVAEDTCLTESLSRLAERSISPSGLWHKLAGPRMYSIFSWQDPMPLILYSATKILPSLIKSGFRKIRQHLITVAPSERRAPLAGRN